MNLYTTNVSKDEMNIVFMQKVATIIKIINFLKWPNLLHYKVKYMYMYLIDYFQNQRSQLILNFKIM
jgi:hypothetical protein